MTAYGRTPALTLGAALLLVFAAQCVVFARSNGQTYDEGVTLASGMWLLEGHEGSLNAEHPPLAKLLAALPVRLFTTARLDVGAWRARAESAFGLGRDFLYASGVPHERLLWLGRLPSIALSVLTVALIGLWSFRLWGTRAALLALGLAAFDPNLVAYGSLIGHDGPLTCFCTAALLCTSEHVASRRSAWLVLAGVACGLALGTKHSAPMVVLVAGVVLLVDGWRGGAARPTGASGTQGTALASDDRGGPGTALLQRAGHVVLLVGIALVVVRLVHYPAGYEPYFAGLRAQMAHQSGGHPAFLLGEISRSGWLAYFPVALAVKEPPLTLTLATLSVVLVRRGAAVGAAWTTVALPAALIFCALLAVRVNIGVRYALPLVPLLIVLASRLATFRSSSVAAAALALGLAHHAAAALRIAPHDLAFFSDAVGGPSQGHRYLADSNLDWGQDIRTLGDWLRTREKPRRLYLAYFGTALPEAYGVHYLPAPNSCPHPAPWDPSTEQLGPESGRELLAVSEMNLQGVFFRDPARYAWLATRTPVAVLGHTIRVYDITGDEAAHAQLTRHAVVERSPHR